MDDEWKRGEQDGLGLSCEWGCSPDLQILNEEAAALYDAAGDLVPVDQMEKQKGSI
jgi:hypothetical protein